MPPLRKRPEDVIALAEHFLHRYNEETGRKIQGFTPAAISQLQQYRWPGNVREIKNVVERAVVLAQADHIDTADLTLSSLATAGDTVDIPTSGPRYEPMALEDVERRHILATLNATGWNKSRSASILGIERSTLDRKIKRYDISKKAGKPS